MAIDFDLRQLEIFCRVLELKSFSKGAEAVSLAQASVSERIANLEHTVGTRLLDRLGRQISPTSAGQLLYRHAIRLLAMKKTACLELEGFLGIKKGEINLGASTIPGEYILPKAIGCFKKKHPFISVTITIADTGKIEQQVLEGNFEMGIVGSKSLIKNLLYDQLWEDELVLAVPVGHRWAQQDEIGLDDIRDEPFILRENGSGTLRILKNYFRSASQNMESLNVVACFGSSTSVKEGVKAGIGISILSKRAMETELKAGILKGLKLKNLSLYRNFYLILDKRRTLSPSGQAMKNFLHKMETSE